MARNFQDWQAAYLDYASYSEAPPQMHFWTSVSCIAAVLQRRCWIDMGYFRWFPNHYIIFVAPPGIVSKSTTTSIGMSLLKRVKGVVFGPDVVTWPALVKAFAENRTEWWDEEQQAFVPMCALTLESSEFGNLFDPQDRGMVDLYVSLWDGKDGTFSKVTKHSGSDLVVNPWINLIGCTTPSWIAGTFPEYVIGGGFTSRTVFVYASEKHKRVAYPHLHIPPGQKEYAQALIEDLERMLLLKGPFMLDQEALAWGTAWYESHYAAKPKGLEDPRFGGYIARKQTHIHKLAMVLSASRGSDMRITKTHLENACQMLDTLEQDMPMIFDQIGRQREGNLAERMVSWLRANGQATIGQLHNKFYYFIPQRRTFEEVVAGLVGSGILVADTPTLTTGSVLRVAA